MRIAPSAMPSTMVTSSAWQVTTIDGSHSYQARAGQRHAGHLDAERSDRELWGESPPSPGLGPVIQVDTSGQVDISRLIEKLDRVRRG